MGRPRAPHGTEGAYRRHKAQKERVCDACQAWKDADHKGIEPPAPERANRATKKSADKIVREIDFEQETLINLQFVEKAMLYAGADKIGPLSKRKSELLRELREYQLDNGSSKPERDPLEDDLTDGANLANVTPIGALAG